MDAKDEQQARRYRFTAWVRSTGITSKQINEATNTNMGGHYMTEASQPSVMTREHLEACRHLLSDIPRWVEIECDIRSVESKNFASREVVGSKVSGIATAFGDGEWTSGKAQYVDITIPATAEAEVWDGWGTALKPAHEPIVLARKPLDGTVANNVLKHGVGGINIDGSRVGYSDDYDKKHQEDIRKGTGTFFGGNGVAVSPQIDMQGRFPANFIHDGSDEVLELFPSDKPNQSAARFFYCAKASKKDRNEGLDDFEEKRDADRTKDDGAGGDNPRNRSNTAKLNHHPTVKPTDLMRYLCRLITPPNGTVLDPFTGSGSTGKAAVLEGFSFIGVEQSEEYIAIAEARIQSAKEDK
jgi:hypothetical protein